jgi:long-chain acyl-CoA synthetase
VLLHKEFDPDEAELTRTRKLRRKLLSDRYQDMIGAMYGGRESVQVRAAVKYRDGRQGIVEREVRVERLEREAATT